MRLAQSTPWWLAIVFVLALAASVPAGDVPSRVDFNRDIRPILSESCYQCHGPDPNKRKADLRLDRRDGLFRSADGTTVVVPGKPDESELLAADHRRRPRAPDAAAQERRPRLSPEQVDLIKRWIEEGAEWKGHWAYHPPADRPSPVDARPAGRPTKSTGSSAPGSPPNGLEPSPRGRPADPDPPPQLRPDRPAADARGGRCLRRTTTGPTPTSGWSTGCSPRPISASGWPSSGSTWSASPTPQGYHSDNHVDI